MMDDTYVYAKYAIAGGLGNHRERSTKTHLSCLLIMLHMDCGTKQTYTFEEAFSKRVVTGCLFSLSDLIK